MKITNAFRITLLSLFFTSSASATLITNGDFGTGGLDGWRTSGDVNVVATGDAGSIFTSAEGMDGNFAAIGFGDSGPASRIWQNFDVSGIDRVHITFDWVFDFADGSNNTNDVFISILRDFDGSSVNNITLSRLQTDGRRRTPDSQTLFGTFDDFIDISDFNTDRARLQFRLTENNGNLFSRAGIDNVSVAAAPVPEPSTILLFGAGLAGLVAVRRKRQK